MKTGTLPLAAFILSWLVSPAFGDDPTNPAAKAKTQATAKVGFKHLASDCPETAKALTEPIANPRLVFQVINGVVAVEAEHFLSQENKDVRAWFRIEEDHLPQLQPDIDTPHLLDSSGGSYLEALPDSRWTHDETLVRGGNFFEEPGKAGVLTYKIAFQSPGRYYVWVRHYSTGTEDNGLHVGLDGEWPESGQRWQTTIKRRWAWDCRQRTDDVHTGVPMALYLDVPTSGVHQIHFAIREDGFEFDKFVLTSDRDYQPEAQGPISFVRNGAAPPRRVLSADYQQEDVSKATPKRLAALPVATERIGASEFDFADSNFYVDQGTWLAINPNKHKTATASAASKSADGNYTVIFHAVGENDGGSEFAINIGGQSIGTFTCPLSIDTFEIGRTYTKAFQNVSVKNGDLIEVTATVGSADGAEYSRGRWLGVTLIPESASEEQLDSARHDFGR